MDAKRKGLEKKLAILIGQASQVAAELQALDQGPGTPHFDDIELPAHDVGRRVSRKIQETRAREVAAEQATKAACPKCGCVCRVTTKSRRVDSADGPLELMETVAKCRRCRRSFFPSAGRTGL